MSPAAAAAEGDQLGTAAMAASATPAAPPAANVPLVNAEQAILPILPHQAPDLAPLDWGSLADAPQRPEKPRPLRELVAAYAGQESEDEQFQCLARAVYFESRGEPLEGQLAVAEVILNRVSSGRFRSTICDVVKQPSQFSFVRRGVIPRPRQDAAWDRAVAIAHIALEDLADVTGNESLFFHATYVNPRWGRPRIARIGNHIFYR